MDKVTSIHHPPGFAAWPLNPTRRALAQTVNFQTNAAWTFTRTQARDQLRGAGRA